MLILNDFAPYLLVSPNLRFEALEQYIIATFNIDLRSLLQDEKYFDFFDKYTLKYDILSFVAGNPTTIEISDTTLLNTTDYLLIDTDFAKKRVKYSVVSATELSLDIDTTSLTTPLAGIVTNFAEYNFFEKLRPFLVIASWIRYSQLGKIQSTNAGLVQKNTDFSEIVSDKEIGLYLQQWKRDLDFYKNEVLKFLGNKCEKKHSRQVYPVTKKYRYDR